MTSESDLEKKIIILEKKIQLLTLKHNLKNYSVKLLQNIDNQIENLLKELEDLIKKIELKFITKLQTIDTQFELDSDWEEIEEESENLNKILSEPNSFKTFLDKCRKMESELKQEKFRFKQYISEVKGNNLLFSKRDESKMLEMKSKRLIEDIKSFMSESLSRSTSPGKLKEESQINPEDPTLRNHIIDAAQLLIEYQEFSFQLSVHLKRQKHDIKQLSTESTPADITEILFKKVASDYKNLSKVTASLRKKLTKASDKPPPKGLCTLCFTPQLIYCNSCETKIFYKREVIMNEICGLHQLKKKNSEVQNMIEEYLPKRIAFLKKKIDFEKQGDKVASLRKFRDKLKADVDKGNDENASMRMGIKILNEKLEKFKQEIEKSKEKLVNVMSNLKIHNLKEDGMIIKISETRRNKINQMLSTLVINPVPSINRIEKIFFIKSTKSLSKSGDSNDILSIDLDDTDLGHLVLFVSLLSVYLGFPMRYPMFFRGSNSYIYDPFVNKNYILSKSNAQFKLAIKFLNRNIYDLCLSQGLIFADGKQVKKYNLLNLTQLLYRCNTLGSPHPDQILIDTYQPYLSGFEIL